MIYDIVIRCEGTPQKVAALRDRCASYVTGETTLINASMAQAAQTYTVSGVDTKTQQPFETQVQATDADDAAKQSSKGTKVVAAVTPKL